MKKAVLLILINAMMALTANAQYVSLSGGEFAKLKKLVKSDSLAKAAFGQFQAIAGKALTETPNPIKKITSEGKLATDPDKIKSLKAVEDAGKIYALALVYKINGDKACLAKGSEYLQAWATTNEATGDPIDETKLEDLITGYDMIRNDVNAAIKTQADIWLQGIADAELNSKYMAPGRGTAVNNWNSHRIKIIAMIVYTLHLEKYSQVIQQELTKHIGINLYPDGSGLDFVERDALHYHIYTLEPLITAATVIYRATGKDYFSYESEKGSSIKKSTDFLVPFVTGEQTHGEFLNSRVEFDRTRAKNNEKDYQAGAKFNPATGIHVLEQAAYFDDKYRVIVQQVLQPGSQHNHDWQLILDKMCNRPSN